MYLYILAVCLILYLNYYANTQGKNFYDERTRSEKCNRSKIYDIMFKIVPDYSDTKLELISDIICAVFYIWIVYNLYKVDRYSSLMVLLNRIILMLLVRGIVINTTILPKNKTCDDSVFIGIGQCYDKLYSGHYGFMLVISYIALSKGIINLSIYTVINLIYPLIILMYRGHYTADLIFAYFAGFFVNKVIV